MNNFVVSLAGHPVPTADHVLQVGTTLITGERELEEYFGSPLTSIESDLLRLASAVFAADRATARGENEDVARAFRLRIPVVNVGRLQPLRTQIEAVLYRLSQDAWTLEFEQIAGDLEPNLKVLKSAGRTLLFSGGADSLAAAVEFGGSDLQLVSHRTMNQSTVASQKKLVSHLEERGLKMPHVQVLVSSRSDESTEHDVEDTQRTRSFVFLVLGAICARRKNMRDIVFLAENGQMAVHLPLTQGRIGSLSTHTAHPEVLAGMEIVLSEALQLELSIVNPFLYNTKAEIVGRILAKQPSALWLSNSCWRSARLSKHCGECIPCFIRRIAIETHCADQTPYARDPWNEDIAALPPSDLARRNFVDLAEFVVRFSRTTSDDALAEWPELLSPSMDAGRVIEMYRRFAGEAMSVLGAHSQLHAFLT